MADHIQPLTNGAQEKISNSTSNTLSTLDSWTVQTQRWALDLFDKCLPPEQRAAILAKLQEFMLANPKLSAFLGMNIALTGPALGLFIVFSLSIATFALIVGVLLGLGAAALFSLFCIATALALVFPVIFFTTMAASFFFLWGLGGYYVLKWLNSTGEGDGDVAKPLLSSGSIGDSLNSLTRGRLTGFMESVKVEKARGDITGFSDQNTPPKPPSAEKNKVGSNQVTNQPSPNAPKAQKVAVQAQQQGVDHSPNAPNTTTSVQRA